jgi:hypothetical protein
MMPKKALHHWRCSAPLDPASLDQKVFLRLVFVMLIDSLPSALWRLVTLFRLPKASLVDFENDSLPSALWRLVTLFRLPKASVMDFEIDVLPSPFLRLVTFFWLPKASVLVCVTLIACAEAVPAPARETARCGASTGCSRLDRVC